MIQKIKREKSCIFGLMEQEIKQKNLMVVLNTYNFIFTIKTVGDNERIKSFTYSDILIENLEIID